MQVPTSLWRNAVCAVPPEVIRNQQPGTTLNENTLFAPLANLSWIQLQPSRSVETHMQDATPLTLGEEWSRYEGMLTDNIDRLERASIAEYVDECLMLVTALSPVIGYDKASKIAHYALDNDLTLMHAATKRALWSPET
jgi:fumarate hydratase class II